MVVFPFLVIIEVSFNEMSVYDRQRHEGYRVGVRCILRMLIIGKGAFRSRPFAKNTASNAYQCAAFFDSDGIVITHTH